MHYGSNYPSGNAFSGGYGGGYGGGPAFPPSSGPPPPPGAYGNRSAYNVNHYGGFGQSGAVAGFTAPAIQQQQHYGGGGQAPPPMQPPASMQYNQMQNAMSNMSLQNSQWQMYKKMGLIEEDEEDQEELDRERRRRRRANRRARRRREEDEEEEQEEESEEESEEDKEERIRKAEARAKKAQEQAEALMEKAAEREDELKCAFIDELMERQRVSGTFEATMGTVVPFGKYDAEDPVAIWHMKHHEDDLAEKNWDGQLDCEYLQDAMKHMGTDEMAIINVVTTRCNAQRVKMRKEFKTMYGMDLITELKSELSGDFRESILALFESPARYDAWAVKDAIYGLGTDEETLIEILMTRTNAQITEMVSEYNKITHAKQADPESSIEKDIMDDTSGDFKRLLVSACQGNRRLIDREQLEEAVEKVMYNDRWTGMFKVNYDALTNVNRCKRMAEELNQAGEEKWGTDEETFNRIFSTQDYYTLRCVWNQYVKITQRDIKNSVKRETSGNLKGGLIAIADNIKCRPMFFAERLYNSMKGLGTKDSTLIRIVTSRAEIDMFQIKACFLQKYEQTLWNFIKDDTSGDYKTLLCGLVGRD